MANTSLEKELNLPRMGETMTEGKIVAWFKKPGEMFRRGETLLEVESDKTNVEVPALEDGEMLRHLAAPGEKVEINRPIALVRVASAEQNRSSETRSPENDAVIGRRGDAAKWSGQEHAMTLGRRRASPAARRSAKRLGLDLTDVVGTGPRGRVTTRDVERHPSLGRAPDSLRTLGDLPRLRQERWGRPDLGTCVLLHGFGGDTKTWSGVGKHLAERGFEAVAIELPGHGTLPLSASNAREMAQEVVAALPGPAGQKFHLVGHSLGGALSILVTASVPDRIRSLTLLAPVGIGTYIDQSFLNGLASVGTVEALERELWKTTARPLSYVRSALETMLEELQIRADSLRAITRMIARDGVQQLFLVPELKQITAPVRILFGRQDRILRWQDALSMPGKVALHLFDAGHILHWEHPTEVLPVLRQFPGTEVR